MPRHFIPEPARKLYKLAEHPFSLRVYSNVALISSDCVVFEVHTVVLSIASPIFADIFSLAQPMQGENEQMMPDGTILPTVEVTETSVTLDNMLRFIYPVADPVLMDCGIVCKVLEAAFKYDLQEAKQIVIARLRGFCDSCPLQVYTAACKHHLEDVAQLAAVAYSKNLIRLGRSTDADYLSELAELTAGCYYRLLAFHKARNTSDEDTAFSYPPFRHITDIHISCDALIMMVSSERKEDDVLPFPELQPSLFDIPNPLPTHDVVLLSSDGIEHLARRSILALTCPSLDALISRQLRSAVNSSHSGSARNLNTEEKIPSICKLTEDNLALSLLLVMVTPGQKLVLDNPVNAAIAVVLSRKYKLKQAQHISEQKLASFIDSDPTRAYFACCRCSLRRFARKAAENVFIREPVIPPLYCPEMEHASAKTCYNLLAYVRDCADGVALVTQTWGWVPSGWQTTIGSGVCRAHTFSLANAMAPMRISCRWRTYFERLTGMNSLIFSRGALVSLAMQTPFNASNWLRLIFSQGRGIKAQFANCPACNNLSDIHPMLLFSELVACRIRKAISQVQLDWN